MRVKGGTNKVGTYVVGLFFSIGQASHPRSGGVRSRLTRVPVIALIPRYDYDSRGCQTSVAVEVNVNKYFNLQHLPEQLLYCPSNEVVS
jgi:hypothetical protein